MSFRLPCLAVSLSFGVVVGGCGGGEADSAHAGSPTAAPSSGTAASSSTATGDAPAASADSGKTTTTALPPGGELQGAKLTETHVTATTAPSSSASTSAGPHTHDPGRGTADIRAIIMSHRDEARACYDRALPGHPGIEGDLVIQWTIDPKGSVTQVSADASRSTISDPAVVACVAGVIQRIQFAPSAGGFETRTFYPFNFHPHRTVGGAATGQ